MDAKRKLLAAVLLGLVWVAVAYWQWGAIQEPVHVPLVNVSGRPAASPIESPKAGGLRVQLELLDAAKTQREAAFMVLRNIFSASRGEGSLPGGSEAGSMQALDPNSEQALRQQAAAADLSQYRYLGFLRMADSRQRHAHMAVLSKNEEVVVVRAGDRFDQYLLLKTISPESVVIRHTGARIEQTIPLSEEPVLQP
jgi:hypothetical protein